MKQNEKRRAISNAINRLASYGCSIVSIKSRTPRALIQVDFIPHELSRGAIEVSEKTYLYEVRRFRVIRLSGCYVSCVVGGRYRVPLALKGILSEERLNFGKSK